MKKLVNLFSIAALLTILSSTVLKAQYITVTIAGTGATVYGGSGGNSCMAQVAYPTDVCTDAAGNLYIADNGTGKIAKVSAKTGILTTYAGGGTSAADGVPATSALLTPAYLCIDAAGNLYVSTGNQVRMINAVTGIITTIAGTGTAGYSGDGSPATAATLNGPAGICIDAAGNLYIVDGGVAAWGSSGSPAVTYIRKVTAATGIISTLAGTGTPGYTGDSGPSTAAEIQNSIAICVDAAGNVYFSDQPSSISYGGAYIRRIDATTGYISTIAGTGGYPANHDGAPAISACIGDIYGMCFDGNGNLNICDISCSVRRIDMTTGIINTIAGSILTDGYNGDGRNSTIELLNFPYGVHVDAAGNLLIADEANSRVRRAMLLTHTPAFVYGNGQYINTCPGISDPLSDLLAIGDLDAAQTETWTIVTPPAHGTLTGFPATAVSRGVDSLSIPTGALYTSSETYTGMDSFQVSVSDGVLSSLKTIYVNVNITIPGFSTSPAICPGSTVYLADALSTSTVAAGTFGNYNPAITNVDSSGNATEVTAGIDTVYFTTSIGCEAMQVNVGPYVSAISGGTSVCNGSEITLANTAPYGTWSAGNGNATISVAGVVTGIAAGSDIITYSVSNGCGTATTTQAITITDCATGVNTAAALPAINVFPSPASSILNIEWSNWQNTNTPFVVTDILGKEIYKATLDNRSNGTVQVDVTNLSAGIYFLKINGTEVKKFVKD